MKAPQSVVKTLLQNARGLHQDIEEWERTISRQEQNLAISHSTIARLKDELAETEVFFAGLEQGQ